MKRQPTDTTARVYAYGCGEPVDGIEHILAESQRARALWDKLVDIERDHDRRTIDSACADEPAIAALIEHLCALSAQIGALIDERRALRAKAREKVPTPQVDSALDHLVPERRAERSALWRGLAKWRQAHKDTVRELELGRRGEVSAARRASGLYWGNYNRVVSDYERARRTVRTKGRRLRQSDPMRERGILTVQIQRTRTGLGASFDELFGAVPALRIEPIDAAAHDPALPRAERARRYRTWLTIRVDAAGHTARLRLHLHRPVPHEARIKSAALTWHPEGERLRYRLNLTLSMPARVVEHSEKSACGIDLGWRLQDEGSLLVATLVNTRGELRRYTLPRDWMAGMDQIARLGKHIDDETLHLAELTEHMALPAVLREAFARWHKGLGAKHIDTVALHDGVRELAFKVPAPVKHWYDRYRHLWLWREHLRAKLLRRRRELYRLMAREIASAHALIALDTLDLAMLARTKKREDGSDPELHALARAQRHRACLHELRRELYEQAAKHGAMVTEVSGPSTLRCAGCGHENQPANRAKRVWRCEGCAREWDQDVNAARVMLASVGASAHVLPEDVPPKISMLRKRA